MEQARIERGLHLDLPVPDAWDRIVFGFSDWFGAGTSLEPRAGGSVTSGERTGHVTAFHRGALLRWEWSADGDPGWTEVEISLHAADGGTDVRVVEVLHEWEQVTYGARGIASSPRDTADLVVSAR